MADESLPDLVGSERDVLLYHLDKNRAAVVGVSEGWPTTSRGPAETVRDAPARPRPAPHLGRAALVPEGLLDEDRGVDDSIDVPVHSVRDQVVAGYREACARTDEILRGRSRRDGVVSHGARSLIRQ